MKHTLILIVFCTSLLSYGQETGYFHLQIKKILVKSTRVQIDTFSIQAYYFEAFDAQQNLIPKTDYKVDYVNAYINFIDSQKYNNQIITLKYLIYPEFLRRTYQIIDPSKIDTISRQIINLNQQKIYQEKPFEGLETKGFITRGFTAGNNQSLAMQSKLDLQIQGKISEKVKIKAVLTDDNLPQGYSGISQSYKEFDRIYMQLITPHWIASGGDIYMKSQDNYFLKFFRKTQGISLQIGKDSSRLKIAGGIVEGNFAINRFNGIEGNQGPYVLKGTHGENYIFIIAKSERVYVNGKLLQQGNNKDYSINYETAELSFNPTFPISQNQRIAVEFNYSNQHYQRYLNLNQYQHLGKKLDFNVYTFLENDNKNTTLLFDLDASQHNILKNAGDHLEDLFVLSATPTTFNSNKILYQKISDAQGFHFAYTTDDIADLYDVGFSYVGQNQGDYKIQEIIASGKIFEYVGTNQGDYEPKTKLTAPKSQQYVGVNFNYHPNENTYLKYDGIINYNDQNLFSSKDDQDNTGFASHIDIKQNLWQKNEQKFSIKLQHGFTHKNFEILDPYHPVEFGREWQIDSIFGKQQLLDTKISYTYKNSEIASGFKYFQLRDSIKATQIFLQNDWHLKKTNFTGDIRQIDQQINKQNSLKATYFHQEVNQNIKKYNLTLTGHYEDRDQTKDNIKDSLNYRYRYGTFSIAKKDSTHLEIKIGYKISQNDSIYQNNFKKTTQKQNVFGQIQIRGTHHKAKLFINYRHINHYRQSQEKDYLNLNLSWQQFFFKKVLMTQIQMNSYNGNTLRNEVVFVETPPGQGTHQWVDYNANGIKEINEFEVAVYTDQANYIQVLLPSKNYISTTNNDYNFSFILNPKAGGSKKIWKRFYNIFQISKKHQVEQNSEFHPFIWQAKNALYQNSLIQNDFFINRTQKKFSFHFTYQNLAQTQLLYVGKQSHSIKKYQLMSKHAFLPNLIWEQSLSTSENTNNSEDYASKNYKLNDKEISENIIFKQAKKSKFSIFYKWKNSENLSGNEKLQMHVLGAKYRYMDFKNNRFETSLSWIDNQLSGDTNSPVAFQMLAGLQTGKNWVLNSIYHQKINSYMEMNIHYSFRLSQKQAAIHTGGIALKMLL